ncbi:MAG: L-serine ammonia-lyase, iron-sulfur-dependent, subunit alpha [Rhodospirillales bacterium]|nr:L-serine ammonia-lyase, iron-sulfur-dependent, subunit alpha [Rhodospirillales bacterium]
MTLDSAGLLQILRSEVRLATGCTEVAGASLAAAKAVSLLGRSPDVVILSVSGNVFKNAAHVMVPGTGWRGLDAAVAVGAVLAKPDLGLSILSTLNPPAREQAESMLSRRAVKAIIDPDAPNSVYFKAEARSGEKRAWAVISGGHDTFQEAGVDDEIVFRRDFSGSAGSDPFDVLLDQKLDVIIDLVEGVPAADFEFLVEAAQTNQKAARADFDDRRSTLGTAMLRRRAVGADASAAANARALSGAAGEARMRGLDVPVAALAGSGNHGIAAFLGVVGLAQSLDVSRDRLAHALAIAAAVTVFVKAHTGRLTTFCGCSIAPATGVAAATVWLLRGTREQMVQAMQTVIGTFAGMLCDGAKESCAFKVATVVGSAVELAELALDGAYVPSGNGIVGATIEQTIENLARLNNPGMCGTERVILEIIGSGGGDMAEPSMEKVA